jgi:hypothetical protein
VAETLRSVHSVPTVSAGLGSAKCRIQGVTWGAIQEPAAQLLGPFLGLQWEKGYTKLSTCKGRLPVTEVLSVLVPQAEMIRCHHFLWALCYRFSLGFHRKLQTSSPPAPILCRVAARRAQEKHMSPGWLCMLVLSKSG